MMDETRQRLRLITARDEMNQIDHDDVHRKTHVGARHHAAKRVSWVEGEQKDRGETREQTRSNRAHGHARDSVFSTLPSTTSLVPSDLRHAPGEPNEEGPRRTTVFLVETSSSVQVQSDHGSWRTAQAISR